MRTETVGEYGEKDLYLTQDENGEWFINSDAAFDDTYELTVVADGKKYKITVTDAVSYIFDELPAFSVTATENNQSIKISIVNEQGEAVEVANGYNYYIFAWHNSGELCYTYLKRIDVGYSEIEFNRA